MIEYPNVIDLIIRTTYDPKPVPKRIYDWEAVDDDTYDAAPDSSLRNEIGYGATEEDAVKDLLETLVWKEKLKEGDTCLIRTTSDAYLYLITG